ncbi:hypothetical protein [Parageobacillus sp. G301]|nr:hypothetical protein [Parageobacillus sp. G301]
MNIRKAAHRDQQAVFSSFLERRQPFPLSASFLLLICCYGAL